MTHICVGKTTIIGSDNGLSPVKRQVIIRTNAGMLLNGPLRTIFSEILSKIYTFNFKKMHLNISSAKWRPFCLGLNVLIKTMLESAGHRTTALQVTRIGDWRHWVRWHLWLATIVMSQQGLCHSIIKIHKKHRKCIVNMLFQNPNIVTLDQFAGVYKHILFLIYFTLLFTLFRGMSEHKILCFKWNQVEISPFRIGFPSSIRIKMSFYVNIFLIFSLWHISHH